MMHRFRSTGIWFVALSSLLTLWLYVLSKSDTYPWSSQFFSVASQTTALLGTLFLALSFILATRAKWLESVFGGLDIVYKLHHVFGAVSFILVLHHPLLLVVRALPSVSVAAAYLTPFADLANTFGQLALMTLLVLLVLTFFVKLPYQIWKMTHEWMGLAILFASLHVMLISSDVSRYLPLRVWMLSWIAAGCIAFIYRRFLYRYLGSHEQYTVSAVTVHDSVVVMRLKPVSKKLPTGFGQFVFVSFADLAIGKESHPFSVVSSPQDDELELWCKSLGDYTQRLSLLKVGTSARVAGAFGRFFESLPLAKSVVGIAGGIGITPFIALLRAHSATNSVPLTIFHSIKSPGELPPVQPVPTVKYHEHISQIDGRLTAEMITATTPGWQTAHFYICGPLPMMESLRQQLLSLGVRPSRICFEDFALKP